MHAEASAMKPKRSADAAPKGAGKLRLRSIRDLDGRTRVARRVRELVATFVRDLGGAPSPSQAAAVQNAAASIVLAEDARARRLAGDASVSLADIVRMGNIADRQLRSLGLKPGAAAKPAVPSLAEYLASRTAGETSESDVKVPDRRETA